MVMSIPLYLGYFIKNDFLPHGVVFAVAYSWAAISFVVIPVLCFVESLVIVRTWIGGQVARSHALRWHGTGLVVGLGSILAVLAVR